MRRGDAAPVRGNVAPRGAAARGQMWKAKKEFAE
jgi:hypothetical protein